MFGLFLFMYLLEILLFIRLKGDKRMIILAIDGSTKSTGYAVI